MKQVVNRNSQLLSLTNVIFFSLIVSNYYFAFKTIYNGIYCTKFDY